jgi:hypothetical protein
VAPSAAQAAGWGINLDGSVTGDPPAFSYQSNPYFTELLGGSGCTGAAATRAICYARINVPWDAVSNGKGSFAAGTCTRSPSGPGTAASAFVAELEAAARAVGMSHVLVSLTTAPPGSPDDIWPTDAEYECGLSELERAAPGVREWEVFNEPDSNYAAASTAIDCTSRNGVWVASSAGNQCQLAGRHSVGGNGHGGSAQAAAYWYLDAKRVDSSASHTLLAGGFNYSSSRCTPTTCYYLAGYFRKLSAIYPHPPDAIALNPYIDVSYAALNGSNPVPPAASGLPSAVGAITAIDQVYPSHPPIWFTEVGVWLTDGGREPVTSGCADGNPQDIGSWAACLNGNPTAQALAAEGYLRLPDESPQVQRVYYYDFDGQNPGWDSGLVNVSPPLLGPRGYGVPRTTWCALYAYARGATPAAAAADALRPGSSCDLAQHGDAPTVDVAYLSDPLTSAAPALDTPGQVGRDLMLTVAERVRALVSTFKGSA